MNEKPLLSEKIFMITSAICLSLLGIIYTCRTIYYYLASR